VADEGSKQAVVLGVEFSAIAHATEDERKVERAVLNLVPEEAGGVATTVQRLSGYHGSPLAHMAMRISNRRSALETLTSLLRSLSPLDRRRLLDEAGDRVDSAGNLYLRLDKQRAYLGGAALHEIDSIRVRFRFRIPHGVDPADFVRRSMEEIMGEAEPASEIPDI